MSILILCRKNKKEARNYHMKIETQENIFMPSPTWAAVKQHEIRRIRLFSGFLTKPSWRKEEVTERAFEQEEDCHVQQTAIFNCHPVRLTYKQASSSPYQSYHTQWPALGPSTCCAIAPEWPGRTAGQWIPRLPGSNSHACAPIHRSLVSIVDIVCLTALRQCQAEAVRKNCDKFLYYAQYLVTSRESV